MASASPPMPQPRSATLRDARRGEAAGVQCGDPQPRGLLETGLGEQHARGELAELARGLRAQSRLA